MAQAKNDYELEDAITTDSDEEEGREQVTVTKKKQKIAVNTPRFLSMKKIHKPPKGKKRKSHVLKEIRYEMNSHSSLPVCLR